MNIQIIILVVCLGGGLIGAGAWIVTGQIDARVVAEQNAVASKISAETANATGAFCMALRPFPVVTSASRRTAAPPIAPDEPATASRPEPAKAPMTDLARSLRYFAVTKGLMH